MIFALLRRWLSREPAQRPDLHLLLYTRAGCRLCDEAWEMLVRYRDRYGFTLELRDVDQDADLVHAFGNCVPVVSIDGQVRFRGRVNEVLLRRILDCK